MNSTFGIVSVSCFRHRNKERNDCEMWSRCFSVYMRNDQTILFISLQTFRRPLWSDYLEMETSRINRNIKWKIFRAAKDWTVHPNQRDVCSKQRILARYQVHVQHHPRVLADIKRWPRLQQRHLQGLTDACHRIKMNISWSFDHVLSQVQLLPSPNKRSS